MTLYLQFFSWSGDDFNVRDGSGNTVFIVKGNALSLRDRVVIADPQGNLIAMMQEKIVSLRKEFQVYSFKPNAEGQESTEKVQDIPVYRFALIQKQIKAITTELCYKLYNGNDVGDTTLIAKAQLAVKLVSAWGSAWSLTVPGFGTGRARLVQPFRSGRDDIYCAVGGHDAYTWAPGAMLPDGIDVLTCLLLVAPRLLPNSRVPLQTCANAAQVMKIYKKDDPNKAPLATVGQTKFVQFESASEYVVSVCPGMDLLAQVLLACAADQIEDEKD